MRVVLEGLLEGHESQGSRMMYQTFMISYVIFTLFACSVTVVDMFNEGFKLEDAFLLGATVILFLSGFVLIQWYRTDGLDPKFKTFIMLLIGAALCLDIVGTIQFSEFINAKPCNCPACPLSPPTYSPSPWTPVPTNHSNGTTPAPPPPRRPIRIT